VQDLFASSEAWGTPGRLVFLLGAVTAAVGAALPLVYPNPGKLVFLLSYGNEFYYTNAPYSYH
jgi:hypothetical protein